MREPNGAMIARKVNMPMPSGARHLPARRAVPAARRAACACAVGACHWQDANMPLPQLGVRFYNPATGVFTQRDPVLDGVNWYAYVKGGVMTAVDPSGESVADVRESCGGLNADTGRRCNSGVSCEQCCNALAVHVDRIWLINEFIRLSGRNSPYIVGGGKIDCQESCEQSCNRFPSGSIAVRNFILCMLGDSVVSLLTDDLLGSLYDRIRCR